MEAKSWVPAAQYVRMSTDEQKYSIANQKAAIQTYAKSHGYVVASTYADAGKSGIEIKHRKELRRLLADVISGRAQYKTILVYDVSRWGRFQDVDEAAHYEFLCKSADIPVRYCAEQFHNDGSLASSMMKALKRTMAAEYSRELGIKVSAGQRRLALLGFRVVGKAGYGMQRMMVSPDGRRRLILKDGERKAIQTDRTILVPGSQREVNCIRTIFGLADLRKTPVEIARELNMRNIQSSNGRPWNRSSVYRILTNDKYAGRNTYGKTTQQLCSQSRTVERHLWITNPRAFACIVNPDIFDRVQKLIEKRATHPERSDTCFIQGMKKVLAREGKLTKRILENKFSLSHNRYKRFGSVVKAYELAGFLPPPATVKLIHTQKQIRLLRNELYTRLKQLFCDRVRFISLPGQQFRQMVEIDGRVRVSIYLCRPVRSTSAGEPGWLLRVRASERDLPVLLCTVDQSVTKLLNFYVFPPIGDAIPRYKILRESQPSLSAGRRLSELDDFCNVAKEAAFQCENVAHNYVVDDIVIGMDTWIITLDKQEITLGPIGSTIFSILARSPNQVVSRERLLQSALKQFRDTTNLTSNINKLRVKLGAEGRKRIQTIPGEGYMYVSPEKAPDGSSALASQWHI
jgi:DNA invertase Pin-like site-specific DNA recombinase/DNA-binding winged helix-turn-helix (wHTH) protein